MSDLPLPSWICAVPMCRVTHTVEESLGVLHQRQATQVVLTTQQDHAFALLSLKDLLWGLAVRVLRLDQPLATVPLHQSLCLLLFAEQSPQEAWGTVWQRLGTAELQSPPLEYGFIDIEGNFLGVLNYSRFLQTLVDYCPGNSLQGFAQNAERSCDRNYGHSYAQDDSQESYIQDSVQGSDPSASSALLELLQGQFAQMFLNTGAALVQDNQRLILDNQYKVILLDRLGHDLKTPLTAIVGLASLLKETRAVLPPPDSPLDALQVATIVQYAHRQGYYGEMIYQNSRYLMELVNRLLALAHLENHQTVLTPRYLPLQPLLDCCWSQAQEAIGLRAPPATVSPCPTLEPACEIWGDQDCCELLLTLFLIHGLEQETGHLSLSLTSSSWGKPFSSWLILTLSLKGNFSASLEPRESGAPEHFGGFKPPGDSGVDASVFASHLSPTVPESLNLWLARRFAQWQGGDLNTFGSHLALLLPQVPGPLEVANAPDPTFILIGLSNPQDWFAADLFMPVVSQLEIWGIFTLFATDTEELISKWQRFRPGTLLLDSAWTAAWDVLSLYRVLQSESDLVQQMKILAIGLQGSLEGLGGQEVAQDYFCLPQEVQRLLEQLGQPLSAAAVEQKGDTLSGGVVDTLLWLGPASPEERLMRFFPGCQVLEAEDVEQAELLVQIWDIQAIVMGSVPPEEWEQTVSSIRQSAFLAPLRLISLPD